MLDFIFPCMHCGSHLSANTSIIGRKGLCKYCSSAIIVPIPPADIFCDSPALIAELDWQLFCPMCKNFEDQNKDCSKLHFNIQSYPHRFMTSCFGASFETDINKVKEFRAASYKLSIKITPPSGAQGNRADAYICPYCRVSIGPSDHVFNCTYCQTPHHFECWQENNGCTVYGCGNAPPDEEKIVVKNKVYSADKDSILVNGGEHQQIDYAGFWKRVVAAIIDGIILTIGGYIVGLVFGIILFASGADDPAVLSSMINMLGASYAWLYHAILESSPTQGTLGKMAIGIKVTDLGGQRIGFGKATGRYFGMFVSLFLLGAGFFIVAFTKKKQGLHDMMAGCLVINK